MDADDFQAEFTEQGFRLLLHIDNGGIEQFGLHRFLGAERGRNAADADFLAGRNLRQEFLQAFLVIELRRNVAGHLVAGEHIALRGVVVAVLGIDADVGGGDLGRLKTGRLEIADDLTGFFLDHGAGLGGGQAGFLHGDADFETVRGEAALGMAAHHHIGRGR